MKEPNRPIVQCLLWAWASPWTAVGLGFGAIGLTGRGGLVRRRRGAIEFCGPRVAWMLNAIPGVGPIAAMTLGHVILGCTVADLDRTCAHERVHVRQCERWGPLFVPAYWAAGIYVWLRGGNAYLDNPFEVEAYREAP